MNNGCICCTVRGDLIRILARLAKKKNKFDYILIETTGLADPAPVAQTFFVDDEVSDQYYLDGIVTVVDAKHVLQHLDEIKPLGVENETVEQIAFADRIILNKVDLLSGDEHTLSVVKERITSINKFCPIIESVNAVVDLSFIVGIKAFDVNKVLEVEPDFLNVDQEHQHDQSVSSVGIVTSKRVNGSKFNKWIRSLLYEKGADIFRSKGIVHVCGEQHPLVFQGVHMLLDMKFGTSRQTNDTQSRLIFIGRNLDRQTLTDSFHATVVGQ